MRHRSSTNFGTNLRIPSLSVDSTKWIEGFSNSSYLNFVFHCGDGIFMRACGSY